jgi:hexosaminidase
MPGAGVNKMNRTLLPMPKRITLDPDSCCRLPEGTAAAVRNYTIGSPLPSGIVWTRKSGTLTTTDSRGRAKHDWHRIILNPDCIEIACQDERTCFFALQTIRQLLVSFGQKDGGSVIPRTEPAVMEPLPCGIIEDWADYEWRGIMLDISRDRVPTMESLFTLIEFWAGLKYNQLQLYMEHTFAYRGHEMVWKDASPITFKELRDIEQFCAARGIELAANQNSFGHMERWLKYPEYHELAEMPDGFTDPWGVFRPVSSTLAPVVDASLDLIDDLYAQLLPLVKSLLVNVGGDEPWELGQGRSADRCREVGLEQVYVDFLCRLHDLAAKYGKRMLVWADVLMRHPEKVDRLPKDTVLVDWGYEANHPFERECEILASSGFDYIICAGNSAWNTIGGRWANASLNIRRAAAAGLRGHRPAKGFMVTEWGDNGHMQQFPVGLPGFILGGATAWNGDGSALEAGELKELHGLLEMPYMQEILYHVLAEYPKLVYGSDGVSDNGVLPPAAGKYLAEALLRLEQVGEIYCSREPEKGIHNTTLLGALLMDHLAPYNTEEIARFAGYPFDRELEELDRIDMLLEGTVSTGDAPTLMQQELRWTADMLRFSCSLGRCRLGGDAGAGSGASAALQGLLTIDQIPQAERNRLGERLQELIAEYRRLWHRRSRPGGLEDSGERLENLLAALGAAYCGRFGV